MPTPKQKKLEKEQPLKLNMPFEKAMKKALSTSIKKEPKKKNGKRNG